MLHTTSARAPVSTPVDTSSSSSTSEPSEAISRSTEMILLRSALQAALETIPVPAAILSASGVVRYTNAAARGLLARDARAFADAVYVRSSPDDPGALFALQALEGLSSGGHVLAVHRAAPDPAPAALRWRRRFRLTGRQTLILEHLARGLASKSIAEILECSEKTVAFHVSSIFDKTGVDSRAALVARFWTER
ncbi:MAG: LuxR C-terminal-related transcriptional regulator [Byssovorax sp.]